MMTFAQLDRRFRQVSPGQDPEQVAIESFSVAVSGDGPCLNWDDLLEKPRVVVLGEPGSGKTTEFIEKARVKDSAATLALFIPLERLVTEPVESALSKEDWRGFGKWSSDRKMKAFFFLDSVDESKRRTERDFLTALGRFYDEVSEGLSRCTIVISSRITEWRPIADTEDFKRLLPTGTARTGFGEDMEAPFIVEILPLDRSRVKIYAKARGINPPDSFLRALDDQSAWPFARRPLDVGSLVNYWKANGRLGSLSELIESDLDRTLAETPERTREDNLSSGRAREGAEALGAAVVFCRQFEFAVPDSTHPAGSRAMDAELCLPGGWTPTERRALLNRAIFDGESFGRIRFHHRSVAEYLAAQWLTARIKSGCPLEKIYGLLFDTGSSDELIIRLSLAPVTAWLACGSETWNREIRSRIVRAAPALFFQFGDPACFSPDYRRDLLQGLIDRYAGRQDVWLGKEPESLARLADPELGPFFCDAILNRELPEEIRDVFLAMVRHGALSDCVEEILDVLSDSLETNSLKSGVAATVRDAGTRKNKEELFDIVKGWSSIESTLCAFVCEAIYPDVCDPGELIGLLEKVEEVPKSAIDLPYFLVQLLNNEMPRRDRLPVLRGLLDLAQRPPLMEMGIDKVDLSIRFYWAAEVAFAVALLVLEEDFLGEGVVGPVAQALELELFSPLSIEDRIGRPGFPTEALARQPAIRREIFWRRVARHRLVANGSAPKVFDGNFSPVISDLDWLCRDIRGSVNPDDRATAATIAIEVWQQIGRPRAGRRLILRAVARDKNLNGMVRTQLDRTRGRLKRLFWMWWFGNNIGSRFWWNRRLSELRIPVQRLRKRWFVLRRLSALRAGSDLRLLGSLAREAGGELSTRRTCENWALLQEKWGRLVAAAVKTGCKGFWRTFEPRLPHEEPVPRRTDRRIPIGLTGIAAAIADGELSISSLTADEARLVTRYAVNELNGFPGWFSDVFCLHREPVTTVVSRCIDGELEVGNDLEHVHEVIAKLRDDTGPIRELAAPCLLDALDGRDPNRRDVLSDGLRALALLENPPRAELARLAPTRTAGYDADDPKYWIWLTTWFHVDGLGAIDFVKQAIGCVEDTDSYVISVCNALGGRSSTLVGFPDPDFWSPPCLAEMIPLVFVAGSQEPRYSGVMARH